MNNSVGAGIVLCIIMCLIFTCVRGFNNSRKVHDMELRQVELDKQQQMYEEGFKDGVAVIVDHGHWTGTNVTIDYTNIAAAMKY